MSGKYFAKNRKRKLINKTTSYFVNEYKVKAVKRHRKMRMRQQ